MTANYVTPYTNELGQTRYQPTLPSGERLWYGPPIDANYWSGIIPSNRYHKPILCKREKQARRIAEYEELRRKSVFRQA